MANGTLFYYPWHLFEWWYAFDAYTPALFNRAGGIAASSGLLGCAVAIRAYLIAQSLNQISTAYGENNAILDNCHVRIAFTSQMGRMERDLQILLETLALFIRYEFTVTPPLPEADLAAARAVAQDRYQAFIEQVGRRIAGGRSVGRDLAGPDRDARNGAEVGS